MPVSKEDLIKEELFKRELARRSFYDFMPCVYPGYVKSKHLEILCEHLMRVEEFIRTEGKSGIGRLIITVPPRHSKSLHVSHHFPGWVQGRNPNKSTIIASYGAELAEGWSLKVRSLVESPEFGAIFGAKSILANDDKAVEVDSDSRKVQAWKLKGYQGELVAAGVGGAITGRGAHLFVIDDPIKDREEADSETMRNKVWDWYTSVARTRLMKGGAIIVMMTRWHEDDLVGRLLEKQKDKWVHLNLPAVAEEGDLYRPQGTPLWPEMFDLAALMDIKEDIGRRDWTSLYQQTPTGDDGDVFKQEWFIYGKMPHRDEITKCFQVWDTAFTERKEGDPSVCGTFFVTRDGLYVADIFKAQLTFPQLKQKMIQQYEIWSKYFRVSRIYVENKGSGISTIQSLKKETRLPIVQAEADKDHGKSKLARANGATGYIESGRVVFRELAPWLTDFENELLKFPRGKHDDMVDVLVYAILQEQGGARAPRRSYATMRQQIEDQGEQLLDRHSAIMGKGW